MVALFRSFCHWFACYFRSAYKAFEIGFGKSFYSNLNHIKNILSVKMRLRVASVPISSGVASNLKEHSKNICRKKPRVYQNQNKMQNIKRPMGHIVHLKKVQISKHIRLYNTIN